MSTSTALRGEPISLQEVSDAHHSGLWVESEYFPVHEVVHEHEELDLTGSNIKTNVILELDPDFILRTRDNNNQEEWRHLQMDTISALARTYTPGAQVKTATFNTNPKTAYKSILADAFSEFFKKHSSPSTSHNITSGEVATATGSDHGFTLRGTLPGTHRISKANVSLAEQVTSSLFGVKTTNELTIYCKWKNIEAIKKEESVSVSKEWEW
jgi:hypothetical protein